MKPENSWRADSWHETLESERSGYLTGEKDKVK
jgi:hypothetical protein